MRLVLASGSPRRSEILRGAGYNIEIIPSGADEDIGSMPPDGFVRKLAEKKAAEVFSRNRDAVVIGADTIVSIDGCILGKPRDRADAVRMLKTLSGREHEVFTGVAVVSAKNSESFSVRSGVKFYSLDEDFIERYVDTGEPLDKAGAYGIQGRGALLVESIEGDYFNIMGLPIAELARKLEKNYGIRPF